MLSSTLSAADSARLPHLALPKLEVMFPDGSSAWLHQVRTDGRAELFTREVEDGGTRRSIDLRRIAPTLQDHLPAASEADRASIMFLTLRQQYSTAADFLRAVRERASSTERTVTIPACEQHQGFAALTVRLPWVCLHCGGPRGEPCDTISYDGSRRLAVHGWRNPCGHVEKYSEVRASLPTADRPAS